MNEEHPKNWKKGVEHPAEDDLLCFIDGELGPKETEGLRAHLEACWHCRNRAEKYQSAISLFIDYRSQVMKPLIEAPGGWSNFSSQLHEQAGELAPPTIWERFQGMLHRFRAAVPRVEQRTMRLAGISIATVFLGFAGIYFLLIGSHTVVSAEELINLASASRENEIKNTDQPVLYQRLSVKRRNATSEDTSNVEVWQDIDNLRIRKIVANDIEEKAATVLTDLEQILRANKYEPPPLSVVGFRAWRNTLAAKSDTVEEAKTDDGVSVLRLQTDVTGQPTAGHIVSTVLVVRAADYHPIEQRFRVASTDGADGVQEFEVRESSFAVMSLNSLNPGFFANSVPMIVSARPSPAPSASEAETAANANESVPPAVAGGVPTVATAELEVEVLNLLHNAGADLGEQIEVRRAPNGPVVVSGVVETPERKNQILNALGRVKDNPAVRIQISTVTEALAAQKSNKARPQPSVESVQIEADTYPAEAEVRAHFKDEAAARNYAARMTSRSSQAMNYLWAMKRLKGQFNATQVQKLTPEARAKWVNVIRSYARSYQSEIGGLKRELQPVFGGGGSGGGMSIGSDAELLQTVDQLFAAGSGSNQVVRTAFTTSSSATNALRTPQFWQTLARAEALAASIERYK